MLRAKFQMHTISPFFVRLIYLVIKAQISRNCTLVDRGLFIFK